jgi:curli biogenesis system outer membrane secretion channel CsgG
MSRVWRVFCVLVLVTACVAAQQAPRKKRVAVMNFDYGTVRSDVAAIWGTDQDIGKGIADLLVQQLVNDGKYSVIERKVLDKILAEQNFSNSDRADPTSAAKIGKVLGVDAIIIGSITRFGRDDHKTTVGAGGFGLGKFGVGGVQKRDAKAVCSISARMVDTSTAEILAVATGDGQSKRGGASLVGAGGGGGGAGAGAFDTSSSNFGNTILGEAVIAAVKSTGDQLDAKADAMPSAKSEFGTGS